VDKFLYQKGYLILALLFISLMCVSCSSVSSYNVNIKYEPTKAVSRPDSDLSKVVFTVAEFNDSRKIDNRYIIGRVVDTKDREIPVITIQQEPSSSIAHALRDALYKANLTVAGDIPKWDLQEKGIKKEWGRIVIGGNIQQLEGVVKEGLTTKAYEAKANIKLMVGDVKKAQIFYIPTYESANTWTDISVSDEKIQKILNSVITTIIDRVISYKELWGKLSEIVKKDP